MNRDSEYLYSLKHKIYTKFLCEKNEEDVEGFVEYTRTGFILLQSAIYGIQL